VKVSLTGPQFDFVEAPEQFPAFVGGFGSGKTHACTMRAVAKKLQYPRQSVAYYLPTYDLVRTIGFPRFSEVLETLGLPYKANKTDATIDIAGAGQVLFRTMDTPERIIGYEVADSLVDELDTLTFDKARDVWNKIISRNRQKKPDGSLNTVGVGTTPEGFRFVYERWVKLSGPGYRLIRAATESNAKHLPVGYIDSLRASYPPNLLAAYLDGEFVNLTAGSVYPKFDRRENGTDEVLKDGEALHIGMDFNVLHGACVVFVLRGGDPVAVDELTGLYDTPSMIQAIQSRYAGRTVYAYPDASGKNRKSQDATAADIALLRQARFTVLAPNANPPVKDRVMAVNGMIGGDGKPRKLKVNVDRCPGLVEALEKQAYDKNGEPDKTAGLDHVVDAAGYFIHYKYPIARASAQRLNVVGI
jgi:hypothetical protein